MLWVSSGSSGPGAGSRLASKHTSTWVKIEKLPQSAEWGNVQTPVTGRGKLLLRRPWIPDVKAGLGDLGPITCLSPPIHLTGSLLWGEKEEEGGLDMLTALFILKNNKGRI